MVGNNLVTMQIWDTAEYLCLIKNFVKWRVFVIWCCDFTIYLWLSGYGWRSFGYYANLGYSWPRAFPEFGCGLLPWGRLLRSGVRRYSSFNFQIPRQLEGRISHTGIPQRPWQIPICCSRQQSWPRKQSCKILIWKCVKFVLPCIQTISPKAKTKAGV